MIDLHIHTNCSDGTKDWRFILRQAQSRGLTHISITDHNNCNAYFQMKNPEKYFSGKIVTGIEPECYYRGRVIELLGYGIDTGKMTELLKGVYRPFAEVMDIKLRALHKVFIEMGAKFSPNIIEGYAKQTENYYASCYLLADLNRYPENRHLIPDQESWDDGIKFFRKHICDKSSPFYFDHADIYPSAEKNLQPNQTGGWLGVYSTHIPF